MTTTIIPTWTLGDRLEKSREVIGLDVRQMAERMGVHRNTISNWENGRVDVPRPAVIAWASVTQVPIWWLLGEESDDPTDPGVTQGYLADRWVTGIGLAA